MAFSATALNYAEQYQRALAQAYPYALYFGELYNTENDSRYQWVDAKTIKIPRLDVSGRVDNSRDTLKTATRNFNNSWETKALENERTWSTLVHPMDIDETNYVASVSNITKVMNEEQKFPEKDRYLVSKVYADYVAAGGKVDNTVLSESNILSVFDKMMSDMTEARVPLTGRLCYITTQANKMLKSAITRYTANGDENIKRIVSMIDEVKIIVVPSDIMFTEFDFTEGSVKTSGAKQINMFLVHPTAVITPEKYSYASLDAPSAVTQGKYFYYEESHEDVFILERRIGGIQFNVSA